MVYSLPERSRENTAEIGILQVYGQAAAQNMQDPCRGRRIFTWWRDGVKSDCFGGTRRYI